MAHTLADPACSGPIPYTPALVTSVWLVQMPISLLILPLASTLVVAHLATLVSLVTFAIATIASNSITIIATTSSVFTLSPQSIELHVSRTIRFLEQDPPTQNEQKGGV